MRWFGPIDPYEMVTFAVTSMTRSGYVYNSSANHDPDGNSNGFSIIVIRP